MIWQPLLVGVVVVAATAYLLRQTWRTWFSAKTGCGGGCSCAGKSVAAKAKADGPSTTLISVNELTQRIRSQS
jgi:hypothetical protein